MSERRMSASEWISVSLDGDRAKQAARSWFAPLCDEMEPVEASVLTDINTDREKKLRVKMRDKNGRQFTAVRSFLAKGRVSISLKPLPKEP